MALALEATARQSKGSAVREFFRGWRRKAGCVTLVMALVCVAGWVRSQMIADSAIVGFGPFGYIHIISRHGRLGLLVCDPRKGIGLGELSLSPARERLWLKPDSRYSRYNNDIRRYRSTECAAQPRGEDQMRGDWRVVFGLLNWFAPAWTNVQLRMTTCKANAIGCLDRPKSSKQFRVIRNA